MYLYVRTWCTHRIHVKYLNCCRGALTMLMLLLLLLSLISTRYRYSQANYSLRTKLHVYCIDLLVIYVKHWKWLWWLHAVSMHGIGLDSILLGKKADSNAHELFFCGHTYLQYKRNCVWLLQYKHTCIVYNTYTYSSGTKSNNTCQRLQLLSIIKGILNRCTINLYGQTV